MDDDNDIIEDTTQDELNKQREEGRIKKKAKQEAKKHAKDVGKKVGKKAKMALFKPVGITAFTTAFSIFIIIFMIVGIISFIITMPGIVQEKISSMITTIGKEISDWWNGQNSILNDPDSEDMKKARIALLQYLDDMGFDPVGLGFVASVTRDEEGKINGFDNSYFTGEYLEKLTGKSELGDLLYKYIVSNERTYLPNDNGAKFWANSKYKGMLSFDQTADEAFMNLKIDRNTKTMTVEATNIVNGNLVTQEFSYNLDEWVGRYGKPTELLLALHLATMSPDLTEELIDNENLQTKVKITMDNDEYNIDYKFKLVDEEGNRTDVPITYGDMNSTDLYEKIKSNIKITTDENGELKWEYAESENGTTITKNDVTISSLYYLINYLRTGTLYNKEDAQSDIDNEKNAYMDAYMKEAINAFLGDSKYAIKLDISAPNQLRDCKYTGPYVCKIKSDNLADTKTGILPALGEGNNNTWKYYDDRIFTIDNGKDSSKPINAENGTIIYKIYGLDYYINNSNNIKNSEGIQKLITTMLIQIDNYYYYNSEVLQPREYTTLKLDDIYAGGTYEITNIPFTAYADSTGNLSAIHVYYAQQWNDFCKDINNKSAQEIKQKLQEIKDGIEKDAKITTEKDKYIQQLVDSILQQKVGIEGEKIINLDDIEIMYEAIHGVDKVKFSYPRIEYVVNHWFKDIDFRDTYKTTTDNLELEQNSENKNLEITAVLSNGTRKKQTKQPYVIKGKVVTLGGEDATEEYKQYKEEDESTSEIKEFYENQGKGYEAAKKIFTQGNYYVYDGSAETSKGIYLNKLLEQVEPGNILRISVVSGRISTLKVLNKQYSDSIGYNTWKDDDGYEPFTQQGWNSSLKEIYTSDYCEIRFKEETKKQSTSETVQWYYIKINKSFKYKSPADVNYAESKESSDRINEILSSMGVVNLRQPVSFDHVITKTINEDGEEEETKQVSDVTAMTAFSVLEGMHTESAEKIYRELKEFLIELGYYSKAEFEQLATNTLTWFIPDYIPEDTKNWQQVREDEHVYDYGALIYPKKVNEETGEIEQNGVEPDLEVIAPGNCRITEYSQNSITLEFDGISEPEIGMLNGYTMIINGIDVVSEITFPNGETANIEQLKNEKTVIKEKSVIGYTSNKVIQVILKNAAGAYLSNVQDYMGPKLKPVSINDNATELAMKILAPFEGESDANPNDGDYYTVEHPSNDLDTIGRGLTGHTAQVWKDLGYGQYIIPNTRFVQGKDNPPETIKDVPIPKSICEEVKAEVVRRKMEEDLEPKLQQYGVSWTDNQKAAWVSLRYNGFGNSPINIIEAYAQGNMAEVKRIWLDCYNRDEYEQGHKKRRATEWELFISGKWEDSEGWMLDCKQKYYGYK